MNKHIKWIRSRELINTSVTNKWNWLANGLIEVWFPVQLVNP